MEDITQKFIDEAIQRRALRFGDFTLKSGRSSPYFFNLGVFCDAASLDFLAQCYAQILMGAKKSIDPKNTILFGAAYKGIPLVLALANQLYHQHGINLGWSFDRKEKKDHGEGGALVGAEVEGKEVIIIDDVLSAGTAAVHTSELLRTHGARPSTLLIALDRSECSAGNDADKRLARTTLGEEHQLEVLCIADLDNLLQYLKTSKEYADHAPILEKYRADYGV